MFIQKMNVKKDNHLVFSTKFLSVVEDYPMARLTNWTNNTANEDIIGSPKIIMVLSNCLLILAISYFSLLLLV